MDGINAALVDFSGTEPELLASHEQDWPAGIREALINARDIPDDQLDQLTELDQQTAQEFSAAALTLVAQAGISAGDVLAIGSHGQTIRHRPNIDKPFSLQIGNAIRIAELTGIDVISDFRTADMALGGQGAPLAPAFHNAVFRSTKINRAVVNIGGISNITVLPADPAADVIGFDCGPGNTLMDAWCLQHTGRNFDNRGELAASGKTQAGLLASMLMDDYFQMPVPKSTGFEYFNMGWLQSFDIAEISVADMQSTLCDLTATSVIRDINKHAAHCEEIYICGGGSHNTELMQRMQKMTRARLATTEKLGVHPDQVEAMTFAWLAKMHHDQLPGNLPSVTGARENTVLGILTTHAA